MKKKCLLMSSFMLATLLGVVVSCSKDDAIPAETGAIENIESKDIPLKYVGLIDELVLKGFDANRFVYSASSDEIIYDEDIVFTTKHLIKPKNGHRITHGLISRENSRNITYFIDTDDDNAFPSNYRKPLKKAMEYWSNKHDNITITEANTAAEADIVCLHSSTIPSVARAEFPANGNVGNRVYVNNNFNTTYTKEQNLTLMLHEVGHALGFTHANLNNGGGTAIPGTHDFAWHQTNGCGSIMRTPVNTCKWTETATDWSEDDTIAIDYIFNDTGDADGDGINTVDEDGTDTDPTNDDTDNDNIPNYLDTDDDGDGIPTATEGSVLDTDNDGVLNYLDSDDDGDSIPTAIEGSTADTDNDGILNYLDRDDDGDDILTATEGNTADTDNDGVLNYLDSDDDGDGITTTTEGNTADTDNDGILNYLDSDDDGDNIPTITEGNTTDTDNDNVVNYLDADDDNDGILTRNEDANNNNNPLDDDTDDYGTANYLDKTISLQTFTNGFGGYTTLNDSEEPNGVNSFSTVNWGLRSTRSSNFVNTTVFSDWLISPVLQLRAGDKVKFRVAGINNAQSKFELRLSARGNNPRLPTPNNNNANENGDFTTILLAGDSNPSASEVRFLNNNNWINFEATIPNSVGNVRRDYKIALIHYGSVGQANTLDVEYIEVEAE
ncbi:M57 family metalloprotease [Aquimarina sp. 2201CG1-2-11]|uniref:M57 family metalloprotease n=1 Tax=Aquimarina discodermiae TaxID=3231043 RepID=UPI003462C172